MKFSPPPRYQTLWNELMACTQLSGNLASITWFRSDVIVLGGQQYVGFWFEDWNRIVLRTDRIDHDNTVKHEMMHALLQSGAHDPVFYNGRCGQLHPIPN
jgi:hypothetical protein